jgi:23S rRNA (uracil1939-C5)-methyltransferase
MRYLRMSSVTFQLKIEKLVYGGWGMGRHEGKVVFVPFTAPGDRVEVKARVEKKTYIMASLIRVTEPGPGRRQPPCPHFGSCGGCQWQHLEYARQIDAKRELLEELFTHRFPETKNLLIRMRGSPRFYEYRSRARVQVQTRAGSPRIGFFRFRSHDVEDIELCPLLRPSLNDALGRVRRTLRNAKASTLPQQVDLASSEDECKWAGAGIELPGNSDLEPAVEAPEPGSELLRRKVGRFHYWISPAAFFQANDFMTDELVEVVMGLASEAGRRAALDLFSGVGLFSLPLALRFGKVLAVDASSTASQLCQRNALEAGLDNVQVVCANVPEWMEAAGSLAPPAFDVILLDPPRAGAGKELMRRIAEWIPETIIYVSCDPQTLLRDLAALPLRSYRIDWVEGLDLFPQTFHFETVVRLKKQ